MLKLSALALATLVAVAADVEAYDRKRVEAVCAKVFKAGPDRKKCLSTEAKAGKVIDGLVASSTSPFQKDALATCDAVSHGSYSLQIECLNKVLDRFEADSKAGIPAFDTIGYCETVRHASGGSYSLEKGCRDQEARSYREIREAASEVPADIMSYCGKLGSTAGGSYNMMRGCIVQEVSAKSSLR